MPAAVRALPVAATLILLVMPVSAQQAPRVDSAAIGDSAGRRLSGRGAINLAAGSGNTQANLAAITLSPTGAGLIELRAQQRPASTGLPPRDASARIDGHAFGRPVGLLSLNQAAGSGNAQLNLFALGNTDVAIAAGASGALDDDALAAVAGSNPTASPGAPSGMRHAVIAGDALGAGQGVVQVNQTAGVGNVSTNAIVLRLPGGAP